MKKYIAIVALSIPALTITAWAQEAPQMQRTQGQSEVTEIGERTPYHEEKMKVATTDLPQEVLQHFEESRYSSMRIVSVYEVHTEPKAAMIQTSNADVENMTSELETTEDAESAGKVVTAEPPQADNEITEAEKALYERVQYTKYSEANSDGYAALAQTQEESISDIHYEIYLEGDQQSATLVYNGAGELLQADQEGM